MNITTVVVDTEDRFNKILASLGKLKALKLIISVAPVADNVRKQASDAGVQVVLFSEVEVCSPEWLSLLS